MFDISPIGMAVGVIAAMLSIYLLSYFAGKGWFAAKLEFYQHHKKWVTSEYNDDRPSKA